MPRARVLGILAVPSLRWDLGPWPRAGLNLLISRMGLLVYGATQCKAVLALLQWSPGSSSSSVAPGKVDQDDPGCLSGSVHSWLLLTFLSAAISSAV